MHPDDKRAQIDLTAGREPAGPYNELHLGRFVSYNK
jgi:hypothetical protein